MVSYMKWKIYDLNSFDGWRSTHSSLRVAKAPEQLRLHALALVFDFQPTQMFGSKSGYELRDIRRHWPTMTLTDRGCGCSCRDPGMSVNLIVEAVGLNKHTCSMTLAEHDGRVSQRVTWNPGTLEHGTLAASVLRPRCSQLFEKPLSACRRLAQRSGRISSLEDSTQGGNWTRLIETYSKQFNIYWTEANYRSNYQNDLLLIDVSWAARIERRPFEIEKEGFDVFVVWPCFHRLQPNLISYTGTDGSRSCFLHLWFYGCFLGRPRGWNSIWVLSSASADHRSRGNSKRYLVAVDLSDSKLRCAEGKFFSFFCSGRKCLKSCLIWWTVGVSMGRKSLQGFVVKCPIYAIYLIIVV